MATDKHEHEQGQDRDDEGLELNAGEPTEQESKLAAELEAEDAKDAKQDRDNDKGENDEQEQSVEAGEKESPKQEDKPAQPPEAADPPRVLSQPPEAPKDFDQEFQALQQRYEDGALDEDELAKANRALAKEEAAHEAKLAIYNDRIEQAKQAASQEFATATQAFESEHSEFLKNPIRRQAMQDAINAVDAETNGTLAAKDLIGRASAMAFEAFGYKPAAPQSRDDKLSKASEARKPGKAPRTLRDAPAAAALETSANSTFSELDTKDISDLEDSLAHMTPHQVEEYLRDAPGANETGR